MWKVMVKSGRRGTGQRYEHPRGGRQLLLPLRGETVRRFAQMTPGAKVAVLRGAAHLTPWDAPDENVRVVREFLRAADSAAAKH